MTSRPPQNKHDWTAIRRQLLHEDNKLALPADWKLPILPHAITMFLQQASRPNYDIRKLSRTLEQDSHLTFELLKYVNSSAMGLRHKSTTAHQALVNLGIRRSKMILLTAAIQSSIKRFNSQLFDLHQFWADNLERSLFAREVAGEIGADLDLAYTGAMLQDFLVPVLSQFNVKQYVEFWKTPDGIECDLTEFESRSFGVHHAEVAAACLMQWNVPDELVCSVLCHHASYDQLAELNLLNTHVYAVAVSSLLPISVPQYHDAAERLADWDRRDSSFDLCDIAERVDAHYLHHEPRDSNREPLFNRIEQMLLSRLEADFTRDALIDRQFGNFIVESCIGEGAMGTVYRARHTMLDRPAAIKVLNAKELSNIDSVRFEREVQLCSRIKHPNTISIYDFGRTRDGLFYYVMELIDGLTLKQIVHLFGPLPEHRVVYLLNQVCQSLAQAHSQGIIHRDIKPENIIVSTRGTQGDVVTVVDFGLVREQSDGDSNGTDTCLSGTPLYMAPESINQPQLVSPSCDIYAIGAVGYFLLCGQPLYTGNNAVDICLKQLSELPPTPSERLKRPINAELEMVVMSCLEKSVEKRPNSAEDVATALQNCQQTENWTGLHAWQWWQTHIGIRPQYETEQPTDVGADTVIESDTQ